MLTAAAVACGVGNNTPPAVTVKEGPITSAKPFISADSKKFSLNVRRPSAFSLFTYQNYHMLCLSS